MVGTEPITPSGELRLELGKYPRPDVQLDPVALTVVEANRLDPVEAVERPRQASRRVLAAGKEDECVLEIGATIHPAAPRTPPNCGVSRKFALRQGPEGPA